jgi:hypothetical protein
VGGEKAALAAGTGAGTMSTWDLLLGIGIATLVLIAVWRMRW